MLALSLWEMTRPCRVAVEPVMVGFKVILTLSWAVSAVGVALMASWEASPKVATMSPLPLGFRAMFELAEEARLRAEAAVIPRLPALFWTVAAVPVKRTVRAPLSAARFNWPLVSLSIFSELAKVISPPAPVLKVRPVVPWTTRLPPSVVRLLPDTVKVLSRVVAPWRVKAPGVVVEPMVLTDEAPEPKVLVKEEPVPMVEAPEEVRVVKAPVEAVVAPMAVELMPVAVVVKWPEVKLMSLPPALTEEADRPERVKAPLVAVRLRAPVVRVKPLEAVNNWVEVKDPVLVVVMPVAPKVMAEVLAVPIWTMPLVEVPVPP